MDISDVSGKQSISFQVIEKVMDVLGLLRLALWPAAMLIGSAIFNWGNEKVCVMRLIVLIAFVLELMYLCDEERYRFEETQGGLYV